jgi:hypothetical protein
MGGRDDRPAVPRALADGAGMPAIEPGAAAAAERPAAGPTGLADALHGAPDLLAMVAATMERRNRNCLFLRLVSKACCEAVDAAAMRTTLAFNRARQPHPAWLAHVERYLAKMPRLVEIVGSNPSAAELGQLLAGPAVAGVQRLEVRDCTTVRGGHDEPGPSLAQLPSLQVCTVDAPGTPEVVASPYEGVRTAGCEGGWSCWTASSMC